MANVTGARPRPGAPGAPGAAQGAPGGPAPGKGGGLADLWHRHPWFVVGGAGAAIVVVYVFWKQSHSSTSGQQNKGGSRRHDRIVIMPGSRGHRGHRGHRGRGRRHGPGGAEDTAGPATGAEDTAAQATDEQNLLAQIGDLQDKLGEFTTAHQRGVSPGGPNPGPQAAGMYPTLTGNDLARGPASPVPTDMP